MYKTTVDYPDEWHNGHHVLLDSEKPVTVRWEQGEEWGDLGRSMALVRRCLRVERRLLSLVP